MYVKTNHGKLFKIFEKQLNIFALIDECSRKSRIEHFYIWRDKALIIHYFWNTLHFV